MFYPMLADSAPATDDTIARLTGTHWFDLKIDGIRCILALSEGTVKLTNRNGVDITYRYPEVVQAAIDKFGSTCTLILDGEIVVMDSAGKPSFKLTSKRDRQQKLNVIDALSKSMPVTFMAFDLLFRGPTLDPPSDRRNRAWIDRHNELLVVINTTEIDNLIKVNIGSEDGQALMDFVREHRMEGLVAKRINAPYQSGRRSSWIKIKPTMTGTFIVVGTTPGSGTRQDTFGALSLALLDAEGALFPVGEVGSGFKARDLQEIVAHMVRNPDDDLLVEVEYGEYTIDGRLRFPVFKGIRTDVKREDANHTQLVVHAPI